LPLLPSRTPVIADFTARIEASSCKVAVKIALKARDFSAKFPTINVSKST